MKPLSERTALIFEELEPRLLFSAGLDIVLIDGAVDDANTLASAASHADIVRVYDSATESAADLLADVTAQAGAAGKPIESLSILAHGAAGSFTLGNETVTADSLVSAPDVWKALGGSLASGANLYLFGCNVASTADHGASLLDTLAGLTGADVFASDDLTGVGGDWTLEAASSGALAELTAGLPLPLDLDTLGSFSGVLANVAPTINLPGAALNYPENAIPQLIDSTATVTDPDSPDFNGGTLTVDFSANGAAEDRLGIRNQGNYNGAIGTLGGVNVTYSGAVIGSYSGGTDGTTPLVVNFNASATPTAVQALLRNITYANTSNDPSTLSRTVRFVVSDGDGGTSIPKTQTVNVTAINDAPRLQNQTLNVAENSAPGTVVGGVIATNAEAAETLTYSITDGNVGNAFSIDPLTGAITVNTTAALNYEAYGSATTPTFVAQSGAANPLNGVAVGYNSTPAFVDIDGDGDTDLFVGANDGTLHYYENVGDASTPTFVERTGAANPLNIDVGERSTPSFVDIDGDGDYDAFIGSWTGGIRYYENTGDATNPQFVEQTGAANPLGAFNFGYQPRPTFADIDGDGDYDAFVGTKSGAVNYYENTGTAAAPVFTQQTGAANPLSAATGIGSVARPTFTDIDGDGDLDAFVGGGYYSYSTYSYSGNTAYYENTGSATNPVFVARTGSANPLNGVSGSNYTAPAFTDIDGDGDPDAFLGDSSGTISFLRNTPAINLTVEAMDNGTGNLTGTGIVSVVLNDVNETPVIGDQSFAIAENSANGTAVGTVAASDPDRGDMLTYSLLSGNTGSAFALDPISGLITVNNFAALDFEANPQFTLGVQIQDTGGLAQSAQITVDLTNVNEAPVAANQTFAIDENAVTGAVVGTFSAADPDQGDTLTYSIAAGNIDNAFALDPTSGLITVNNTAALDFETNPQFTLSVQAQDSGSLTALAQVTINLRNLNETPVVSDQTYTLDENTAAGTPVATVAAADPDQGDVLTYSILGGNTDNAFAIDAATGRLTVNNAAAVDFESHSQFDLSIKVADTGGMSDTAAITLRLNNVNERPDLADQVIPYTGKLVNGTRIATLDASDPDANDTVQYAIVAGNERGAFAIDPNGGQLTIADITALDLDREPTVSLGIRAQDAGGLATTASITVDFRDAIAEIVATAGAEASTQQTGTEALAPLPPSPPPLQPAPSAETTVPGTAAGLAALDTSADEAFGAHGRGTHTTTRAEDGDPPANSDVQNSDSAADAASASNAGEQTTANAEAASQPAGPVVAAALAPTAVNLPPLPGEVPAPVAHAEHSVSGAYLTPGAGAHALPGGIGMSYALDNLSKEIEESAQTQTLQQKLIAQAATGLAVTASAGVIGTNLRGGSLLASLLSTIPVWKGFDPLPVLAISEEQRRKEESSAARTGDSEGGDNREVARILDPNAQAEPRGRFRGHDS